MQAPIQDIGISLKQFGEHLGLQPNTELPITISGTADIVQADGHYRYSLSGFIKVLSNRHRSINI